VRTAEVVRQTGVTYRRLDQWAAKGFIRDTPWVLGSGRYREWTAEDVARVVEIRDALAKCEAILRAAGIDGFVTWMK
jgi:DNA-binding transcriptional MerR regulator